MNALKWVVGWGVAAVVWCYFLWVRLRAEVAWRLMLRRLGMAWWRRGAVRVVDRSTYMRFMGGGQ